jgi:hypothetical protein
VTDTTTKPKRTRGTSNGNAAGSSKDRAARKRWLVATYRADVDILRIYWPSTNEWTEHPWMDAAAALADRCERVPACRCYRCGKPLSIYTVTVDRIIPGCHGGTYRRTNIRPACGPCNSFTGGSLRSAPERVG